MCDTFVALGSATIDGKVIFGKNSDRPYPEVQNIVHIPRRKYSESEDLRCTYINISQVRKTYEVLLSQPYWM